MVVDQVRVAIGQCIFGNGRRGDGCGGREDHIHLFENALEIIDDACARALCQYVILRGEGASQCEIETHIQAMFAVMLCVGVTHGLRHFSSGW